MKKVVLVIFMLFSIFGNSQNQSIINKMTESKSIADIKDVADAIVLNSKDKYDFYKIVRRSPRSDENYQYIIYTKEGMSEVEKKELSSNNCANCIIVKFSEWQKGENADLEIKGELIYDFKEVTGKYLDLVGFWTNTFYPLNSKEQVLDGYNLREYRVNKELKFNFRKNETTWTMSRGY
ncbi:hypothetical protein KHA90_25030 [Flavobacterium psychroterrae]|uniref:Uncharacterized protein n=2 Tax=Flavobacterium psychroterrae TaxID=2133767 RepID=A0ABS5PKR7_9FLAO|nr:hypothetical protein [Flavobacterium psychroterrae]MBS7234263.1 hypothetical protein [Flavobacterium psychroterrae]